MARHVLPNVLSPVIVVAVFAVANMIVLEATLSFLGLGVEPSVVTWGRMLNGGRLYLSTAWWLTAFPGLAIFVTVLAVNLLGDHLRDWLDPRLRGSLGSATLAHRSTLPAAQKRPDARRRPKVGREAYSLYVERPDRGRQRSRWAFFSSRRQRSKIPSGIKALTT